MSGAATADAPSTLGGLARTLVTRGSPRLLIAAVLAAALWRATRGPLAWPDLAAAAGVLLLWPLQEWTIHRWLLHWKPRRLGRFVLDFAQARKHRRHHLRPWDFAEVSIPLHTFAYALPLLTGLAWVTRDVPGAASAVLVYLALGLHYEACHFMAHSNYVPRTALYRALWKNHRLHHFKNETQWLGVSMRLGDRLLGTNPDQKQVPRSATCRTLGVAPPR
ncbi:MAG: sterol desaturase family protein [Planctomycetota bacterium]